MECEPLEAYLAAAERRIVRFAAADGSQCTGSRAADVMGRLQAGTSEDRQYLRVAWPGGSAEMEIPAVPRHTFENILAAAAGCYAAGLPVDRCLAAIADLKPTQGRGRILEFPGLCLIDDTYNANPAAVEAAIDDLIRVAARTGGRPVAVLGDMRELGPEEELYHRRTGQYAAAAGVKVLWGVGRLSSSTAEGFLTGCGPDSEAGHVESPLEASVVASSLQAGDVVLFKASRMVRLEAMVEEIGAQARSGRWASATGEPTSRVPPKESGPIE